MRRISCLMLDMGRVLTQEHREDKVEELRAILGSSQGREAFLEAYYSERLDYDRGSADGPEYWRRVARKLGLALPEASIPDLVRTDLESWFNMRESMLEYVGGLRGRVGRLVLLSNVHADGARYLREGAGRAWASLFDELVLSCEHLLLKPERRIYELALERAGAAPRETLFVDDNPENVEGALAVGLCSFQFVGEEDFYARLASEYELVHR